MKCKRTQDKGKISAEPSKYHSGAIINDNLCFIKTSFQAGFNGLDGSRTNSYLPAGILNISSTPNRCHSAVFIPVCRRWAAPGGLPPAPQSSSWHCRRAPPCLWAGRKWSCSPTAWLLSSTLPPNTCTWRERESEWATTVSSTHTIFCLCQFTHWRDSSSREAYQLIKSKI